MAAAAGGDAGARAAPPPPPPAGLFLQLAGMSPMKRSGSDVGLGGARAGLSPRLPPPPATPARTPSRVDLGGWGGEEGPPYWPLAAGEERAPRAPPPQLLCAPFVALVDGECVLPPATRAARFARLLGDETATIVSLLPAATEALAALGDAVWRRVQGVSDQCPLPDGGSAPRIVARSEPLLEAAREPPQLDAAWLAAAAPTLVVTGELLGWPGGEGGSGLLRALTEARLLGGPAAPTAVLVLRPRTLSEALEAVEGLGWAVGAGAAAQQLLAGLRGRLRAVAAAVAPAPRPRPTVLSLEGLRPLLSGGLWLAEMKALAGGTDPGQSEPGGPAERLRWESVLAADPDVLLLIPPTASLGAALGEVAGLARLPGFWALRAVRANRLFLLHHGPFSRPGPRLVEGVEILARVLHPQLWGQPLAPGAALQLRLPPGRRCRPHQLRDFFEPYE